MLNSHHMYSTSKLSSVPEPVRLRSTTGSGSATLPLTTMPPWALLSPTCRVCRTARRYKTSRGREQPTPPPPRPRHHHHKQQQQQPAVGPPAQQPWLPLCTPGPSTFGGHCRRGNSAVGRALHRPPCRADRLRRPPHHPPPPCRWRQGSSVPCVDTG